MMNYTMEELVPIVGRLVEKYTLRESTSITYEKAEQLMEAVLYCIHEAEQFENHSVLPAEGISAQQVYEAGLVYVGEKTKKALDLYNQMLSSFECYENHCLYDTFAKGIPEFFKWYDIQFAPQNTILMLDYPVLRDLSGYTGIDKIYEFIICIYLEQKFLNIFPKDYVIERLRKYNSQYKDMIENICEIVFVDMIGHILAGKPLSESTLEETDYLKIQKILMQNKSGDIKKQLTDTIKAFLQKYDENGGELLKYLAGCMDDIIIRLKNAAENDSLPQIV
ncbi:MAG: DUF6179 domain-containing protein [Lachnospiraceae bacterium]